jgi:creatinine amidohydrolase
MSIEFETLRMVARDVLSELVRNGFSRIIVLTGHAGSSHMTALKLAAQDIVQRKTETGKRKPRVMVLSDYDFADELKDQLGFPPEDGHAGAIETGRVMAIKPELVKGRGEACFPKMPRFEVVADPERFFPGGVMGDPTLASAEKGKRMNEYIVDQVAKIVEELKSTGNNEK